MSQQSETVNRVVGWKRIAGTLTYKASDGTKIMVFQSSGSWWWSATDGRSAKYSTAYLTEREAWRDAVHFQESDVTPLRGHDQFAHQH